jgi:hypothetical protein
MGRPCGGWEEEKEGEGRKITPFGVLPMETVTLFDKSLA